MIRKALAFFRFATKAERLMLAYKAWGYDEDQVIERWRADLHKAAMDTRPPRVDGNGWVKGYGDNPPQGTFTFTYPGTDARRGN
jgi:hypothetical protein